MQRQHAPVHILVITYEITASKAEAAISSGFSRIWPDQFSDRCSVNKQIIILFHFIVVRFVFSFRWRGWVSRLYWPRAVAERQHWVFTKQTERIIDLIESQKYCEKQKLRKYLVDEALRQTAYEKFIKYLRDLLRERILFYMSQIWYECETWYANVKQ